MEQETQQAIENTNTATLIDTIHNSIRGENLCFNYLALIARINRIATLHPFDFTNDWRNRLDY